MRFVHVADVHLGYQQYGLEERALDIARAFGRAVAAARDCQADAFLIAGDLFHNRQVDPSSLLLAITLLERLKEAGIPVLAVAGNHDLGWRGGAHSWLTLLHDLGYLTHLDLAIENGRLQLESGGEGHGSLYETDSLRVIGLPYLGASLPRLLPQLPEALSTRERKFTVLMLHAGIEGSIPGVNEPLRHEHLQPLRGLVDYVALGHRHMPFERSEAEPPIYNPGSLEAIAADEAQQEGGWFTVEVSEDGSGQWSHTAQRTACPRRPFHRLLLDVADCPTPDSLQGLALRLATASVRNDGQAPIVDLALRGRLLFSPASLDLSGLASAVEAQTGALKVLVRNLTSFDSGMAPLDEGLTRAQMEEDILRDLIGADSRYRSRREPLAHLALELKDMALAGAEGEELFSRVLADMENHDPTGPTVGDADRTG